MAKLYPPVIEGTIPAFNGTDLTVPFSMNRSVSVAQIGGFAIKVKTIQSNTWLATITTGVANADYSAAVFNNIVEAWTPTPGQFYKIQLAYIDKTTLEIGYYSTVGVVKYTDINRLDIQLQYQNVAMKSSSNSYPFAHEYAAVYNYEKDPMEKIYQYKFNIYDSTDEILYTSDWLLHDATQDSALYTSVDRYTFVNDLPENQIYTLNYEAITVNGLHLISPRYSIIMSKDMISQYQMTLEAINNYDNGYVEFIIHGDGYNPLDETAEQIVTGQFKIYRRDTRTRTKWEQILVFHLSGQQPSVLTGLRDFTVEHGVTYEYKVCQFNNIGIMAICGYSNQVYVDFEDMFLFDGERQLKVRFNPKVSSFKNDILESKMETIGSKYPFFFRNGVVHYKEFPISGLISYWMDNEELFMTLEELGLNDLEKSVRHFTVTNPFTDSTGIHYSYDYNNLGSEMMWACKRLFVSATHWLGNREYFTYNAQLHQHEPIPPIQPDQKTRYNEEIGEWEYVPLTRADYEKEFQEVQKELRRIAWQERLAAEGQYLPVDPAEIDAHLENDKTVVLYVFNKTTDWRLILATQQASLIGTPQYDWKFESYDALSKGALVYEVALDGYRNVVNRKPRTTNLVNYNIAAERQFKLEVLEWLTNGKPKLFRSPAEGNYIIRLLNTSLTPTDSLGRMLHSFSSTAYEIDDLTYETLIKYGFIKSGLKYEMSQYPEVPHDTIILQELTGQSVPDKYKNFDYGTDGNGDRYFEFLRDITTGAEIRATQLYIDGGYSPNDQWLKIDNYWRTIPDNQYNVTDVIITSIKFYPDKFAQCTSEYGIEGATLTFWYLEGYTGVSDLDAIEGLEYAVVPTRQFVQDIIPISTSKRSVANVAYSNQNILLDIEDVKTRLAQVYQLTLEERPILPLYCDLPWDSTFASSGLRTFEEEDILQHFSFSPNIAEWDEENGNESTLETLKKQSIYIYQLQPATQDTLTRATAFMSTLTDIYESILDGDVPSATFDYYLLTSTDPAEFIEVAYQDIDWELIDVLYVKRSVDLSTYEIPEGEGRHCYINGVRYDSTDDILEANIVLPNRVSVYTTTNSPLENINQEDLIYAVFDAATIQLRTLRELDTKVYINTGDRRTLSAETKNNFDLTGRTIDVSEQLQPIVYFDLDDLTDIYIGNGVLLSMSYQTLITTYHIESHEDLRQQWLFYNQCKNDLEEARKQYSAMQAGAGTPDPSEQLVSYTGDQNPFSDDTLYKSREEWVIYAYKNYITALTDYMALWEEENPINGN